jgi:hypothetical protein
LNYQFIKQLDAKRRLGKKTLSYLIGEESRSNLSTYIRKRSRKKLITRASRQRHSCLNDLVRICLKHISPVTAPLALISQIENSGGSLLNQLFDGHPEIHCHPQEFLIGYPHKSEWPKIKLKDNPQRWFEILFEEGLLEHMKKGNPQTEKQNSLSHFVFLPHLQKQIFIRYLKSVQPIKQRDVFDAYMTSYFGAWLNYRNLGQPKKMVTAFAPWLAMLEENTDGFFEVYPDGKIISIVKDPTSWFVSACAKNPQIAADIRRAMSEWQKSMRALRSNKQKFRERVCLIKSEDLVANTEAVMRYLADFLGINYDVILLKPTFNGFPIAGQNSFTKAEGDGNTGNSYANLTLDKNKLKIIEDLTSDDYQVALHEVVSF